MADTKPTAEIKRESLRWLGESVYASSSLETLSGGSANFVYRARLLKPQQGGLSEVIIKHSEGYMAVAPENKFSTDRCQIAAECLKCLASVRLVPDQEQIPRYVVRTPHCYLYEKETNNQILVSS